MARVILLGYSAASIPWLGQCCPQRKRPENQPVWL